MPAIDVPAPALGKRPHTVAAYAFDGMSSFELGCVVEVFGLPRPELGVPWYALKVCAETSRPLRVVGGFTLATEYGLDELAAADTAVVTAVPDVRGEVPVALVEALLRAHARGARIVSVCSGAFALAAAGLLDGLEATTHWRYAALLAERFPAVRVDPDVLYVDRGRVLTSAGSAAGLDLCLHLVRLDHGPAIANAVARRLVLPPHREGGQAQYIEAQFVEAPLRAGAEAVGGGVARSMDWALENLAAPLCVADLARVARMSQRSYLRNFARATGTSPLRWLVGRRVAAARALLESTDEPVERIGAAVGFADPASFRHHFGRVAGTSPSAYRRAFHA
jgi:AraC family transcriptional regulator, transcriptional activator FtrA